MNRMDWAAAGSRWLPLVLLFGLLAFAWTKTSFAPSAIARPAGTLVCPSQSVFSLRCPGCGSTRAIASVMEGRWGEAFRWNPLLPFALVFAGISLLGGTRILRAAHWPWTILAVLLSYTVAINLIAPFPG